MTDEIIWGDWIDGQCIMFHDIIQREYVNGRLRYRIGKPRHPVVMTLTKRAKPT